MSRQPFQEEDENQAQNASLKVDQSKSRFAKKSHEAKTAKVAFDEQVESAQENSTSITNTVAELSGKFMSYIKDRKLEENKGPIQLDLEKETTRALAEVALQLNNDDSQPEGIGSVGLCQLLLRIVLFQRDRINKTDYQIHLLQEEILALKNDK